TVRRAEALRPSSGCREARHHQDRAARRRGGPAGSRRPLWPLHHRRRGQCVGAERDGSGDAVARRCACAARSAPGSGPGWPQGSTCRGGAQGEAGTPQAGCGTSRRGCRPVGAQKSGCAKTSESLMVQIIGGGLAGCEAAWQIASRGVPVTLYEMRPVRPTAVHKTDRLAELVCSNSFRGDKLDNAVGLLKEEMRRLGSLVMRAAEASRVPAGAALAVDRDRFAETITRELSDHPLVTIRREEVHAVPPSSETDPVIIATGPLTSEALSRDLARVVGSDHLYFYDAI